MLWSSLNRNSPTTTTTSNTKLDLNLETSTDININRHINDELIGSSDIGIQATSTINNYAENTLKRKYQGEIESTRGKRGRGRGSRGSYKPRGHTRFVSNSSINSSYNYGTQQQLPRVCVNPEILKILGYTNQNQTDYGAQIDNSYMAYESSLNSYNISNNGYLMPNSYDQSQFYLIDNHEHHMMPNTSYQYPQQEVYPCLYNENMTDVHENDRLYYNINTQNNINQMISNLPGEIQGHETDLSNVNSLINDKPDKIIEMNKKDSVTTAQREELEENPKKETKKKKKFKKFSSIKNDKSFDQQNDD